MTAADALDFLGELAAVGGTPPCDQNADVNCSGGDDLLDVLDIARFVVGPPRVGPLGSDYRDPLPRSRGPPPWLPAHFEAEPYTRTTTLTQSSGVTPLPLGESTYWWSIKREGVPTMKLAQYQWTPKGGWSPGAPQGSPAQLILVFGGTAAMKSDCWFEQVKQTFPRAHIFGCSTAGEIFGTDVFDDSLVLTAVEFGNTRLAGSSTNVEHAEDSFQAGKRLALSLDHEDLAHVLVLSDGLNINGSELVLGLTEHLPEKVGVTGGLAGDGDRFSETLVSWDCPPRPNCVAAVGLYGSRISVGCGSLGGWDQFGPERLVTRSTGNVLYEMDGQSALELYKKYLGEHSASLPASGLLFPLALRRSEGDTPVVRTILSVDESSQSMTFAGDVQEGWYARLMKANFDRLIDGAMGAAQTSHLNGSSPELAILISCVGRKMVLKQRVEEEVDAVRDVLGAATVLTGFYSYGEISLWDGKTSSVSETS